MPNVPTEPSLLSAICSDILFQKSKQHLLVLGAYRDISILTWGKLKYASAANSAYEES